MTCLLMDAEAMMVKAVHLEVEIRIVLDKLIGMDGLVNKKTFTDLHESVRAMSGIMSLAGYLAPHLK